MGACLAHEGQVPGLRSIMRVHLTAARELSSQDQLLRYRARYQLLNLLSTQWGVCGIYCL